MKRGHFMYIKDKSELESSAINFNLPLIIFEEDGATICYCPALDLSGYGHTEQEAIDSYKFAINEYLDYCSKNRTLIQDLKRLGWHIKNRIRQNTTPPPITKLLAHNDNFRRVFENFDYKKLSTNVLFPAYS